MAPFDVERDHADAEPFECCLMFANPRDDYRLKPGNLRGAQHRNEMRHEKPILRDSEGNAHFISGHADEPDLSDDNLSLAAHGRTKHAYDALR